jgi:hypothetical protein
VLKANPKKHLIYLLQIICISCGLNMRWLTYVARSCSNCPRLKVVGLAVEYNV